MTQPEIELKVSIPLCYIKRSHGLGLKLRVHRSVFDQSIEKRVLFYISPTTIVKDLSEKVFPHHRHIPLANDDTWMILMVDVFDILYLLRVYCFTYCALIRSRE